MRKGLMHGSQGEPVFLSHSSQNSHGHPPFWRINSLCGFRCVVEYRPNSIPGHPGSPGHADPRFIFESPKQLDSHSRFISPETFAESQSQTTISVVWIHCEPPQKVTTSLGNVPLLKCIPADVCCRWRRRQCDVLDGCGTPCPRWRAPFHAVGLVPPRSPAHGVAGWPAPAQESPPE